MLINKIADADDLFKITTMGFRGEALASIVAIAVYMHEMQIILQQLQKCKQPFTCPHGRPTMIQFTIPELEKRFKRVV